MKKTSRIAVCHACNAVNNGVKSRIALKHTCGKVPKQSPEWVPSNPNLNNPYGCRQTNIQEHLDEYKSILPPEDFDRIVNNTEYWHKQQYGIGYKE